MGLLGPNKNRLYSINRFNFATGALFRFFLLSKKIFLYEVKSYVFNSIF